MTPRISAAMVSRGRVLSEPRLSPGGERVAFVDRVGGESRLVVMPVAGGPELVVTADLPPAGRGGVVDWAPDGSSLVYAAGTGAVAVVAATGGPPRVVAEGPGAAAVAVSPDGREVAFVLDTRTVAVAPLEGGGGARTVSAAADFAVDPAWSPDGRWLVWHEWDVPAMAWDESRVRVAPASGPGEARTVAGGPGVSVQQPRFSPTGEALAFLSDAGGWCHLWVAAADGTGARPLVDEEHEHGEPTWGPGQRSFAWSPDGRSIAFDRNESGFGRLCVVDVGTGRVRELSRGLHESLSWAGGHIACTRSGARTPTAVVALDPSSGARTELARGPVGGFVEAGLVEPELVHWTADDGAELHGRLYRPAAPAGEGAPPPLLLWAHGGPTGQHRVSFDPTIAWFVDRGWAVLAADPRGSTGWGRAYAQALRGGWGQLDVDDLGAGMRAAAERGWADPARMVPMGTSSGGMAVLLLLARHPGLCAAGVAFCPVSDLLDLASTTHRFEAHYLHSLVGPLPEAADLYRQRSPLEVVDAIGAPVLVLHGGADEVVPPAQSAALADRLAARVEHHEYEGEGHGFRRPATVDDALARTETFLQRALRAPMGR